LAAEWLALFHAGHGGAAILLISEDLDEILELSDRVLVMAGDASLMRPADQSADRYEIGRHMAQGERG
jgi:ABC-type uncharacterized transport system ATPase subunit